MKKSEDFRTRITRRGVLKGAAAIGIPLINASGFSFSSYQVPTLGGMGFFALMLSMLSIGAARLRKK